MTKQDDFMQACESGDIKLVKILLKDTDVNPTIDDNYAIQLASENAQLDILKELLNDQRIRSFFTQDEIDLLIEDRYLGKIRWVFDDVEHFDFFDDEFN